MTIKDTITQELMDSAGDPVRLDAVFQRHGHSKGPLYTALGEATLVLRADLVSSEHELVKVRADISESQRGVAALVARQQELDRNIRALDEQVEPAQARLAELKALLERLNRLATMGFGEAELGRLSDLLGQMAASQGMTPEDGVRQFFDTVKRYETAVSLDLEAKRAETRICQAKADADRWEAEAKAKEARSKARAATIDIVDEWLSHGVKEQDLPRWTTILEKSGVNTEGLAKALGAFGTLEAACARSRDRADKLGEQICDGEVRLKALKQEEAQVKAGISAVREAALADMDKVAARAMKCLEAVEAKSHEYGELQRESAKLEAELILARALGSDDSCTPGKALSRNKYCKLGYSMLYSGHGYESDQTAI